MAFDPGDYDEVYETHSAPEKATLLRQGWVVLVIALGLAASACIEFGEVARATLE